MQVETVLPDRDLAELAVRLRGVTLPEPRRTPAAPLPEGTEESFKITDLDDGSARQITATLQVVTDNTYWFVDNGAEMDIEELRRVAKEYEERVRPAVVGTFGDVATPGIDGDPRLVILNSELERAGGYYGSKDAFPAAVHPHSNEREIIYIDSEILGHGSELYLSVIAHELQHAIHSNGDVGEESWVNEGMSELSAEVAGFEGQFPSHFLRRPQTQLNFWADETGDRAAHYGAAALFFSYLSQRLGGAERLIGLVSEPLDGIRGVEKFLEDSGSGLTFDEVFADWVVANYLDADDPRYGYSNHDVELGRLPALYAGTGRRLSIPQFSARHYLVATDADEVTIRFQGDTQVAQVGAECAEGPSCWWGGRGDGIDTKLTREVDLTGLDAATLEFAVWYEIEESWDYGYVEVSADDGETWHILRGDYSTTENPSGNAYGPGYTGKSDEWKRESIDLTPFVGGPVLLRFEYVTDDAVYLDGLVIDDVSIPELGFRDDRTGWTAEGFSLTGAPLAQEFIVQVIVLDSEGGFSVSRIALDDSNRGSMTINGLGENVEEAVVIVSPTTPGTTQPAGFTLEFTEAG